MIKLYRLSSSARTNWYLLLVGHEYLFLDISNVYHIYQITLMALHKNFIPDSFFQCTYLLYRTDSASIRKKKCGSMGRTLDIHDIANIRIPILPSTFHFYSFREDSV